MSSSDKSDKSDPSDKILPPHGGYRRLRSFSVAECLYDGTVVFCDRFIAKGSRTHDQMVQAARSGARNIPEGSEASGTSKKTELKLTNVAKASLEELLLDYEAFLRQRGLRQWPKDSPEALAVRGKYKSDRPDSSDRSDAFDPYGIATAAPEVAANTLLCLCHQATYLLKRQIARLERDFAQQGGITERLYRRRVEIRAKSDESDKSDPSDKAPPPACPRCGKPMRRRTARQGPRAGQPFWGCSGYPECRGIVPIPPKSSDRFPRSESPGSCHSWNGW